MLGRDTRRVDAAPWPAAGSPSPQRVRWGAVFAGVVLGLALLALLTTLWFALAFNSNVETIRINLEWYVGGSAIASLFIGGLLAGWLSGVRGAGSGLFNGITMWGLILIVALAVGIPAVFNVFNLGRISAIADGTGLTSSGVNTGALGVVLDDPRWVPRLRPRGHDRGRLHDAGERAAATDGRRSHRRPRGRRTRCGR